MSRKWIGVVIAVVLAAVGTWVLVRYVQGAENRALEGEETVQVLVVDAPVSAGTAAEDMSGDVRVELVPVKVQAPGSLESVEDLESLGDLVVSVDLIPGEQVIEARFITPQTLEEQDDIVVPDGLLEVTLSLTPERAIGGILRPGDHVAVFASFESFTLDKAEPGADVNTGLETEDPSSPDLATKTPSTTHIILHKVLVTNVQVEELPSEDASNEGGTASLELSPTGNLLVTVAMEPANAERFIFTAEFGTVWLATESDTVGETETMIQDRLTVYEDPVLGESP
jgi:pilus assembly protein CpaB